MRMPAGISRKWWMNFGKDAPLNEPYLFPKFLHKVLFFCSDFYSFLNTPLCYHIYLQWLWRLLISGSILLPHLSIICNVCYFYVLIVFNIEITSLVFHFSWGRISLAADWVDSDMTGARAEGVCAAGRIEIGALTPFLSHLWLHRLASAMLC